MLPAWDPQWATSWTKSGVPCPGGTLLNWTPGARWARLPPTFRAFGLGLGLGFRFPRWGKVPALNQAVNGQFSCLDVLSMALVLENC
eukprot:1159881-Pelagomonas_calceolata.AAC.7